MIAGYISDVRSKAFDIDFTFKYLVELVNKRSIFGITLFDLLVYLFDEALSFNGQFFYIS